MICDFQYVLDLSTGMGFLFSLFKTLQKAPHIKKFFSLRHGGRLLSVQFIQMYLLLLVNSGGLRVFEKVEITFLILLEVS